MQKGASCQIGVKMVRDEHPLVGPPEAMARGVRFVMSWYAARGTPKVRHGQRTGAGGH